MPLPRIALVGACAVSAIAASCVVACSPAKVGPTAPTAASRLRPDIPVGPPYLEGELAMPPLDDVSWRPPELTADDTASLREIIGKYSQLRLVLGPELDDERRAEGIGNWVRQLAGETRVTRGESVAVARLLGRASLPVGEPGDGGESSTVSLDPDVLARLGATGNEPVLLVDRAPIELDTWRARPAKFEGTCDPVMSALGSGQEQSLAILEPFLDHADAVLRTLYMERLSAALPTIRDELAEFAEDRPRAEFSNDQSFRRHSCGRQVLEYMEPFEQCVADDSRCSIAPRLFVLGGARIGVAEPAIYVPDECPELLGRDYQAALREPARTATEDATDHFETQWSVLVDRFATLGELHAALEDVCLPRRRKFSDSDLDGSRKRLQSFGELFRNPEPVRHDARWLMNEQSFHSPGIGAVHQLAQFDSGTGSAARELTRTARGLREYMLGSARCQTDGEEVPLVALLVDVQAGRVEFVGYFYDEQLLCREPAPVATR